MSPRSYDLARIEAIKAYAKLEHTLAYLLSRLVPCDADAAWTIFFRIGATRSRYAIIDDLCALRDNGDYRKPWSILEKHLVGLDTKRNHIIHWTDTKITVVRPSRGGTRVGTSSILKNPAKAFRSVPGAYAEADLVQFAKDALDMENLINLFALTFGRPSESRDIFLKATADQTPAALLQSLFDALPDSTI